jgi:hypothetical protein
MYGETGRSVVVPADMLGDVSATRAKDLEASSEALSDFVSRVDKVLRDLEGSAGNPKRVGAQTVSAGSIHRGGRGAFHEADGLYDEYHAVHNKLTALSKTLHLQIEAIGIAVQGARGTFDGVEEDQRRRFWEIQTEITRINAEPGPERTNTANSGMSG